MKVIALVAVDRRWLIGADGDLPWKISSDLKRFKSITMGKPLVMGRATYESIGRALPGRRCVVMTRRGGYEAPGCEVVSGLGEALELLEGEPEVVIGGGAQIYELFADRTDEVHLTVALGEWEGDTRLRPLSPEGWRVRSSEYVARGPRDDVDHVYLVLEPEPGREPLAALGEVDAVPDAWCSVEQLEE